jgi:hypothetical protein
MEEIQQRLKDAADQSMKTLAAWASNKQNTDARESLLEAIHELRKVSARLEIEIATSERSEVSQRALPIPSHRSHQRRPQENDSQMGHDDSHGNQQPQDEGAQQPPRSAPRGQFRRPVRRPAQGE